MKNIFTVCVAFFIFEMVAIFGTAAAQPTMPEIFSDEMVLQQNTEVAIWGKSRPRSEITLSCSWLSEKITAKCNDSGNFIIRVKTLSATPVKQHTFSIADNTGTVEYNGVIFGEVWLAGGQSNMAFELKKSKDADKYIEESNNENIRFYYAPHNYYEGYKVKEKGRWVKSSIGTAGSVSGVAYHFAVKLQKDLNVPVGIILCYKGGTPVESWMSKETLEKYGEHSAVWNFFNNRVPADYDSAYNKYLADSREYKKADAQTQKTLVKPAEPYGWRNYKRPEGLYELMLKPLIPYTVKGFIWYQGEGNAARAEQYRTLFPALIREWRNEFFVPNAPFIFAQLPIYEHPNFKYAAWAELREAQLLTSQTVENTAMAVILDAGDKNDLHPADKFPVGQRMALAAESIAYDKNVVFRSPEIMHVMRNDSRIILSFSIFDSEGLALSKNCNELSGFEAVLDDGSIIAVKAVLLDENKVELHCNSTHHVKQVRYGWANYFEPCLVNMEGLYASPFRVNIE